jgi:hypothetical protein
LEYVALWKVLEFVMHNHVTRWQDVQYKARDVQGRWDILTHWLCWELFFQTLGWDIGTTLVQFLAFHFGAYYLPSESSMGLLGSK